MAKDRNEKAVAVKRGLSKGQIIILGLIAVILIVVAILVIRWLVTFQLYDGYKQYITSKDYAYAQAETFAPIEEAKADVEGENMVLALENDNLKLYLDQVTAQIAVYDKRSGAITYSNPADADEDPVASGLNINYLKSQIVVDYFDAKRNSGRMDSFSNSTELGQFDIQSFTDEDGTKGVRVIYNIGNTTLTTGIAPIYIKKTTLEEYCAKMDSSIASFVKGKYSEKDAPKAGYLKMSDAAATNIETGEKLNKYFVNAGFTQALFVEEMEGSGVADALPLSFSVPLEYRLASDSLLANVPVNQLTESGGGYIYKLQVLPYFGCTGTTDDGYLLVPDGAGALIRFNNGKQAATVYSEYVYGIDPLAAEYTVIENSENTKMALFGVFKNNDASLTSGQTGFLATIDDAASFAVINAGVSGKINNKNYVNATFVLRGNDKLAMFGTTGNEAELPIIENENYDANISIRYMMLNDEDATYSGAANKYRERLIAQGDLVEQGDNSAVVDHDIKFYYDVLGGVPMTKFFLGTQYNGMYTMTTFNQAKDISNDLANKGIHNQVMNFQGWMNGGYYHSAVNELHHANAVGSKSDMEKLNQAVIANGGTFYADVAFQKVTAISKHYESNNETSRYYGSGYIAQLGLVNPTTLRQTAGLGYEENRYFLLSPKFLNRYVNTFSKDVSSYDIGGLSLRDLGDELHSDKKRTEVIDRESALDMVEASFSKLEETTNRSGDKFQLMVSDGNDYAWKYASDIINAPIGTNEYILIDEAVPFYEMVIHGCIDYSGNVINLNDKVDETEVILDLIAAGASPHFVFTKQESSDIKNTGLNRFYATTYNEYWQEKATRIYSSVNEVLKGVSKSYIVAHENVATDVEKITYSNGTVIYVNYLYEDTTVDGITVPARSTITNQKGGNN